MQQLLSGLMKDFPAITFTAGPDFCWSPREQIVYYADGQQTSDAWTLLHEASHGILQHKTFKSDFQLLQLELAAWEKAKELAKTYKIVIDTEHIEDCLDTYRDWLHKRSLCPTCGIKSLQQASDAYCCFNCGTRWHVSTNRLCRPYRAKIEPTAR